MESKQQIRLTILSQLKHFGLNPRDWALENNPLGPNSTVLFTRRIDGVRLAARWTPHEPRPQYKLNQLEMVSF